MGLSFLSFRSLDAAQNYCKIGEFVDGEIETWDGFEDGVYQCCGYLYDGKVWYAVEEQENGTYRKIQVF